MTALEETLAVLADLVAAAIIESITGAFLARQGHSHEQAALGCIAQGDRPPGVGDG